MATAVLNTTKRKATINSITLNLSAEEAIVLRSLLGQVGGDPIDTVRLYTERIFRSLNSFVPNLYDREPNVFNSIQAKNSIDTIDTVKTMVKEWEDSLNH